MSSSHTTLVTSDNGKEIAEDLSRGVQAIRSRICNAFLVVMAIIAVPSLAASLYRINAIGWQPVMAAHIVIALVLVGFAVLRNRLPYALRAGILVVIFLIIGLGGLWQFGLIAGGTVFVVAAGPIAAMFFGGRVGLLVLLLSLLSGAAVGLLIVTGRLTPAVDLLVYAVAKTSWVNALFGWLLAGASLTVLIYVFNEQLIEALKNALRHEANLKAHQRDLENTIEERTEVLRRSNEDLEQFAQIAAHDMRSPLNVISGHAQLLSMNSAAKLDDEAREHLQEIIDSANHVNAMVMDLLEYSKLDSEARVLVPVDMNAVMAVARKQLRPEIESCAANITVDSLPRVSGDEMQMIRVMQNLLANAMRYRKPDQSLQIHVSAQRESADWRFSVRDNGIGIAPTQTARIFQIFSKVDTGANPEGVGIGLAACRKIIERHGGRIWVESELGLGSTFYFTLKAGS